MIAMYIAVLDSVLPHPLIAVDFVINDFDLSGEQAVDQGSVQISTYTQTRIPITRSGIYWPIVIATLVCPHGSLAQILRERKQPRPQHRSI